jgi:hypothetical protein
LNVTGRDVRRAELVAFGLLLIEGLLILGDVAAAIANQAMFGAVVLSNQGSHAWGYTLSLASAWSSPPAVAIFLLVPLGLVAWVSRRGPGDRVESRADLVLRLALTLALLTVLAGILSVVGRVLQYSPSESWSSFFVALGAGIGSVCLGILGIIVVHWLAIDLSVAHEGQPADPLPGA